MATLVQDLLDNVPSWVIYLVVFLLPFLEASVFLGFVIPGETALVFGGVLAGQGKVSLGVLLVLAVVGAFTGDGVGYAVGRRYGSGLQASKLGQRIGDDRWRTTEQFLHKRGGTAVFFGRWTAVLRAMVPGVAGMAGLSYKTFALYNALGGTLWAVACVYGGYLLGNVIGSYLSNIGYLLIALVVLALALHLLKRRRETKKSRDSATSDLSVH